MKNLFTSLLTVLVLLSAPSYLSAKTMPAPRTNDTVFIGQLHNDVASFVADSNVVRNDLQHFINVNQETAIHYNHIQITYSSGTHSYYLVASGTQGDKLVRTALALQHNAHSLFVTALVTTCTTNEQAGEQGGCLPMSTACTACSNGGECEKSISMAMVVFPSIKPSSRR